jgi:hypothetical protein
MVLLLSMALGPALAYGPAAPLADDCSAAGWGPTTNPGCLPDLSAGARTFDLKLRNKEGQDVLNRILADEAFWRDAWKQAYTDQVYDEIRLKDTDSGYVPMITGEGDQDFAREVVADIVYFRNTDLPGYMDGAKAVVLLGSGYDSVVGAEYRDCFYVLDLTAFYGYFPQRMYRRHDSATDTTVLWFEKLNQGFVGEAKWTTYQKRMQEVLDGLDRRMLFNSLIEVTDVYGMFVVEPGQKRKSRVSFVSKLTFGSGSGWIAQVGSKLPPVLKAGLKSGFSASVAIARQETERRKKATP